MSVINSIKYLLKRTPGITKDIILTDSNSGAYRKRALLSHAAEAIKSEAPLYHHNAFLICRAVISGLNELGYIVDLVDFRDDRFVPKKEYDLFIGHGMNNFSRIHSVLKHKSKIIYLASGSYWKFHNSEEIKRIQNFKERTGIEAPPDRFFKIGEEEALDTSEKIIIIGNEITQKTYSKFSNVERLNGIVTEDSRDIPVDINTGKRKKSFVYFAGHGNIHKGLDLIIEAFKENGLNLYILSHIDEPIRKAYGNILDNNSNIKSYGLIKYRSEKFYEIIRECGFVILPSCSEGQAVSVCECMLYGLVPVVTEACGIDIDDFGFTIKPHIGSIKEKILEIAGMADNEMVLRMRKSSEHIKRHNTFDGFRNRFKEIISAF